MTKKNLTTEFELKEVTDEYISVLKNCRMFLIGKDEKNSFKLLINSDYVASVNLSSPIVFSRNQVTLTITKSENKIIMEELEPFIPHKIEFTYEEVKQIIEFFEENIKGEIKNECKIFK